MKNLINKLTAIVLTVIIITIQANAQSPEVFNYQAMALNSSNMPYKNQSIKLQISLLEGGQNGHAIYVEHHNAITSDKGLFSLQIGDGNIQTGSFSDADWSSDNYWMKVEADFNGGNNFTHLGTNKMVSVPYAMHAQTVENADDADADPTNEIQILSKNGMTVSLSNNGGSFTDETQDADADPNNEIQNLSLNNNTLSLSQSNATVDLSKFEGPWVKVPNSNIIEYKTPNSLARVRDDHNTLNLTPDIIEFIDTTECSSLLSNGSLLYNRVISPSPKLITYVAGFTKDSIYFDDYDQNSNGISHSMMSKDISYFYDEIGGQKFEGSLEPFQLDLRINDTEAWGNYDAYGLQARAKAVPGLSNDWELDLKAGFGLYMSEADGNGSHNATLSNQYGLQIGKGIGFGIMDEVRTKLNQDSLIFDYFVDNGFQSGFAHYGRYDLSMKFQAGPLANSSCMSASNICIESDQAGAITSMNMNWDNIEFDNPNGGFSFTHMGLDSMYMSKSVGLLFPDEMTLKPHVLKFEDQYNQSFLNSWRLQIKSILSPSDIFTQVDIRPDNFTMFNSAKWKNIQLSTELGGNAGQLELWSGTGDFKLAKLSRDNLDGLSGSLELYSNNSGSNSKAWLRIRENHGELTLDGPNTLNVLIGARNDEGGLVQVYDGLGVSSASMYADSENRGILRSDHVYIGEHPGDDALFPLKVVQTTEYGMNLERADGNQNWEFYVKLDGSLGLYSNSTLVGQFNPTTGAYSQISDSKLKSNIHQLETQLSNLMALNPSRYTYKNNNPEQKESIGLIAQDVQKLFPELVNQSTDKRHPGLLTVDYSGLSVLAIKVIQEQQIKIESQASKIEKLEDEMNQLKAMVETLINQK